MNALQKIFIGAAVLATAAVPAGLKTAEAAGTVFTTTIDNTGKNFSASAFLGSLTAGTMYDLMLGWTKATSTDVFSSFGAYVVDSMSNTVASVLLGGSFAKSVVPYTAATSFTAQAGQTYTLLYGTSQDKVKDFTVTVAASPLPSPGPIAGAGLPIVLGLMGFAAWRRRNAAA